MTSASGAYCIVKPVPVPERGRGVGEKCLQLQVCRDAGVVWAGGLHSGRNARNGAEWGSARQVSGRSLRLAKCSRRFGGRNVVLLSGLPPSGGRGPRGVVVAARRALCMYLSILCRPGGGGFLTPRGDRARHLGWVCAISASGGHSLRRPPRRGGTDFSSWRGVSSARWRWGWVVWGGRVAPAALPAAPPALCVAGGTVCPWGPCGVFFPLYISRGWVAGWLVGFTRGDQATLGAPPGTTRTEGVEG
jgi:hypothetical protein